YFMLNDYSFYVGYKEQGYYSIKRNGIQVALFLLEPYSNGGRNRYCVWYEHECCEYLGFLIFFMTMTDYMLNTNRTNTGRTTWTIYYKKADSEEIKWRPSDTDEAMLKKEEKYVEKIAKQEKTGQRMGILLLIYLVIFFLIFFAFRSIS
ncbi:MAG: hypothetical protein LIO44_00125, partial [Eubacterium sp.]|nr:hypothetical protein [Eubacterium sp.]